MLKVMYSPIADKDERSRPEETSIGISQHAVRTEILCAPIMPQNRTWHRSTAFLKHGS